MHIERGLAIFIKPTDSIVDRASSVNLSEAIGVTTSNLSSYEFGSDLKPGDIKLCGFEAKMTLNNVKRFFVDFNSKIISIEIESKRKRILPVNHNIIGSHA